jgi:hypothetical protein
MSITLTKKGKSKPVVYVGWCRECLSEYKANESDLTRYECMNEVGVCDSNCVLDCSGRIYWVKKEDNLTDGSLSFDEQIQLDKARCES